MSQKIGKRGVKNAGELGDSLTKRCYYCWRCGCLYMVNLVFTPGGYSQSIGCNSHNPHRHLLMLLGRYEFDFPALFQRGMGYSRRAENDASRGRLDLQP